MKINIDLKFYTFNSTNKNIIIKNDSNIYLNEVTLI